VSADAAGYRFRVLPGVHAVCRLATGSPVPTWATGDFVSITSTADEVSIMCLADHVPAEMQAERDWRVLKVVGPFPFIAVGVMLSFAEPLAAAGISILAVATYDTDYVLVKEQALARAITALTQGGHRKVN
jgi:hypothetical protein